jgi:hypothetical protein
MVSFSLRSVSTCMVRCACSDGTVEYGMSHASLFCQNLRPAHVSKCTTVPVEHYFVIIRGLQHT